MKKINNLFLILSFLTLFSGCTYFTQKNYIETFKTEDLYPYQDKDNLFIFDIDSTLLRFYMPGKNGLEQDFEFDPVIRYTVENLFKENKDKLLKLIYSKGASQDSESYILKYFDKFLKRKVEEFIFNPNDTFYKTAKVKPVDPKAIEFIKKLQNSGIHVMVFTARSWKTRKETEEQLLSIGINVNKNLIYNQELVDDTSEPKKQFGYKNGLLFIYKYPGTDENAGKGPILINFLNKINYNPKKVIFVDNVLPNVKSIANSLQEFNIPVVAFWYRVWDKDVAVHPETIKFFEENLGPNWNKIDINLDEAIEFILDKLKIKENKENIFEKTEKVAQTNV